MRTALTALAAASLLQTPAPTAPMQALDAYLDIDVERLTALAEHGETASALLALMTRERDAAARLGRAAADLAADDPDLAVRLEQLAVGELQRQGRWSAALALDQSVPDASADVFAKSYALFPGEQARSPDVVTVPFDGLRIPGRLNGREIAIALDTGAPGVGVNADIVRESGLEVDLSVSRRSAVPALDLVFDVYPVRIDRLEIGESVFENVPANFGDLSEEDAERAAAALPDFDVIMGLDVLGRWFQAVELDYDARQLRLIRGAQASDEPPNFIHGGGLKPVMRIQSGERAANIYLDTGAYGHSFPPGDLNLRRQAARRFERSWGSFTEYLVDARVAGGATNSYWTSGSGFGADERFRVEGVFGDPQSGTIRVDLQSGRIEYSGYRREAARYSFDPVETWAPAQRPCASE
ncbi:MAG: retropepsin-like aspartic protease [Oceanicaulis sp.]